MASYSCCEISPSSSIVLASRSRSTWLFVVEIEFVVDGAVEVVVEGATEALE